jgi:hypothetical protein
MHVINQTLDKDSDSPHGAKVYQKRRILDDQEEKWKKGRINIYDARQSTWNWKGGSMIEADLPQSYLSAWKI